MIIGDFNLAMDLYVLYVRFLRQESLRRINMKPNAFSTPSEPILVDVRAYSCLLLSYLRSNFNKFHHSHALLDTVISHIIRSNVDKLATISNLILQIFCVRHDVIRARYYLTRMKAINIPITANAWLLYHEMLSRYEADEAGKRFDEDKENRLLGEELVMEDAVGSPEDTWTQRITNSSDDTVIDRSIITPEVSINDMLNEVERFMTRKESNRLQGVDNNSVHDASLDVQMTVANNVSDENDVMRRDEAEVVETSKTEVLTSDMKSKDSLDSVVHDGKYDGQHRRRNNLHLKNKKHMNQRDRYHRKTNRSSCDVKSSVVTDA